MASQTTTHKRDLTRVQPRDQQMRERLGFDRRGIRREFAAVADLDLTDKYIETEDRTLINPHTTEMPYGPSEFAETEGSGIEMYVDEGDQWQTYRFTHGFATMMEDLRAGNASLGEQRDEVSEIFDFYADSLFLKGVYDQSGNQIRKGMFQWLKDNIPSERTLDMEDFDGDSGEPDYTDDPENIFNVEALDHASGNLLDDENLQWDNLVCRQSAFTHFQHIEDTSQGADRLTHWQRLSDQDMIGGVSDYTIIPDQLEYPYTPENVSPLTVDLTTELGTNEAIVLPDMEAVSENYWQLNEMAEPEWFDPYQTGGGQVRYDAAWRFGLQYNPDGHKRWASAEDALHLKNLDVLFN